MGKIDRNVLYWSRHASGGSKLPVFGIWAGNLREEIGELNFDLVKFYESQEDLVEPDMRLRRIIQEKTDKAIMQIVQEIYN